MRESYSVGTEFFDVLLLIFIVLKLVGVIDWSWWWVLSPIWIWALVVGIIFVVAWFISD